MKIISDGLSLQNYVNAGYDGNPFAYGSANGNGISYKIQNTDISSYDLITIEGGTNDFKLNIELGEVGKIGDTDFDNTTTCGALRQAIEYILTNNPTAKVILISDPQRNHSNYDVNYINSAGYKLIDYVNAIINIGQMYGIPVCDWYHLSGINEFTLSTYTSDGLHPNALGYKLLGKLLLSTIKNAPTIFFIESIENVNANIATINGTDYDISCADSYKYKMIMLLSENYYLYASNSPFYVYDCSTYNETFCNDAVRYSCSSGSTVFDNRIKLSNMASNITSIEDSNYYKMNMSRTIDMYVWTNNDLLYYSSSTELAVGKS